MIEPEHVHIVAGFNTRISPAAVETLAADIEANGQIQPITVRRMAGALELVTGQRRLEAIRLLNERNGDGKAPLRKVRVEVVDNTDLEALLANIAENNERADLTAVDHANQVQKLLDAGMQRSMIATTFKRSKAWVSTMEGIGKLPEPVKEKIVAGLIPASAAAEITRIKKPEDQLAAAEEASKLRGKGSAVKQLAAVKVARRNRKAGAADEGARVKRKRAEIVTFFEDELAKDGTVEKPGILAGIGEVLSKYAAGFYTDPTAKSKLRSAITDMM
ncbi:MAG TPA: ParB/RepB/Spo0J family partition protein [Anaerolineales bacterium]